MSGSAGRFRSKATDGGGVARLLVAAEEEDARAADGAVVEAALVAAQRLLRRERLPAHVALVRRGFVVVAVGGRASGRGGRQHRLLFLVMIPYYFHCRRRRRWLGAVAGLVPAERLVRRERLAADGAAVVPLPLRRRRGDRGWDVAAGSGQHDEAERQVLTPPGWAPCGAAAARGRGGAWSASASPTLGHAPAAAPPN